MRFISIPEEKCPSLFHSVNAKGNWAHLAQKNSQLGAKITTIFRLHESISKNVHKKHLKTSTLTLTLII